ncbi:hypothetical protein BDV34DRAFT_65506 [Aspergillus parasiticus]|uniref:Uncharacterized protein n=1 Tax=Aspergillus parasiticus TaxID=5067 RepID=A0A5N6DRJ0_ASPPA|nr:hypothetical protein BDV34DRAFT_65506 [Aspergillus parasiticus]
MIPFEMAHHGLELFSDHLGQETVEVVAINCTDLTRIICYPELGSPAGDFPNLKALTVYISEDDPELGGLSRLLRTRDLQFIHLEKWIGPHTMRHNYRVLSGKLLPYIRAHQNLRALVLDLAGCGNPLPEEGEEEELLWPRLKALYLHCADDQWLLQLFKFKELQIFKLLGRRFASSFDNSRFRTAAVAKCKHLRVVEIPILSLFDHNDNNHGMNFLMDIVRGCPLLQRLSLPWVTGYFTRKMKEPLLFDLLSVLPRLEVLELGMDFWVYGTELQDLAHHCPRLTFLDLNGAKLYVSLAQMSGTLPFRQLEFVRFKQILFKKPGYLMQEANFQTLATEWSRIFPKLRTTPCLAEFELDNDPSDGSEEDGASVRGDEKPSFPDADDDGTNSDWQSVRSKLWEALSYVEADEYASEKFQHMWQTNFEIETIGWPVLSSEAFTYTWPHSFPPRGYC